MQLPLISQPVFAYFDATDSLKTYSNYPSISNLADLVNNKFAKQSTNANQPTFNPKDISVPFYASSLVYAGIDFAGSQWLSCDPIASTLGAYTVVIAASCSTPASGTNLDLFGVGNTGSTASTQVYFNSSSVNATDINDAATTVTTIGQGEIIDTKLHIYTMLVNSTSLTVRQDGYQILTATISGAHTFNTFTIGGLNSNGSVTNTFKGTIAEMVVFNAINGNDYVNIERYMMMKYGLKTFGLLGY